MVVAMVVVGMVTMGAMAGALKQQRMRETPRVSGPEMGDQVVLPYTAAPAASVPVIGGEWVYPGKGDGAATFVMGFNKDSGFLRAMWDDPSSLDALFLTNPFDTKLVVISYEKTQTAAEAQMAALKQLLDNRVEYLSLDPVYWGSHVLFAKQPLSDLEHTWLPSALRSLPSALQQLVVSRFNSTDSETLSRVDGFWPFSPQWSFTSPSSGPPLVLLSSEQLCSEHKNRAKKEQEDQGKDVNGAVVYFRQSRRCSVVRQLLEAQLWNASGIVMGPADGDNAVGIRCVGLECDLPLEIPVTMVTPQGASVIESLLKEGSTATVYAPSTAVPGFFLEIDGEGLMRPPGDILDPTFAAFLWEAQYLRYQTHLTETLAHMRNVTLPVMRHLLEPAVAQAKLPVGDGSAALWRSHRAFVDFSLECRTGYDDSCPDWDRILPLQVSCGVSAFPPINSSTAPMELQRYITSFHRTGGRWLTDITSLLPLLSGPFCNFFVATGTGEAWYYSFDLVWDLSQPLYPVIPASISFLWSGGEFNNQYNSIHPSVQATLPPNTSRAEIVAIFSGHGSDSEGCGEFCPTEQVFTVTNSAGHATNFSMSSQGIAGTQWGCANMGLQGAAPNQYGTYVHQKKKKLDSFLSCLSHFFYYFKVPIWT